jgi:succinyl-diaminopimelate desuccinylase
VSFTIARKARYTRAGWCPLCAEQGELLQSLAVAVCLEPTDNRVEAGCSGSLQAQVMASGKRAHSARPWLGQNAIYAAAPLLQKLATWQRRPVERLGLTFYEVMSATQILTENARNVIPDRVMVNVNYRFCPGKSLATAEAELREFIGPDYAVHVVDACPSGAVCTDHPDLGALDHRLWPAGDCQAGLDRRGASDWTGHPGGQLRTWRSRASPQGR